MTDIVERARWMANSEARAGIGKVRGDLFRELADEIERLRAALATLVADWDAVSEDVQVPEEINVNEHWDAARAALKEKRP
jgi:hypothetical protein